ncbi:Ubiquitin family protein [Phytophthora megakarya]|uniref:Ubiquitin family protein n=1 Tax=Phytophthora megakarya TaxID=4795 RepID=A0A225UU46_9STRA|nr:Ubiquitin family protein [Phytophthora megakarya]
MSAFSVPIPWRSVKDFGLSGVVEITSSDIRGQDMKDVHVREFIAMINKKLREASPNPEKAVTHLLLHGVRVNSTSLLEHLVPELMANSPRFLATTHIRPTRPKRTSMVVFVKKATGATVAVECTSKDTINYVKNKVTNKYELFSGRCITYSGKILRDHQTLAHYNVKNLSTLYLTTRLRGGFNNIPVSRTFADVSDTSLITPINFDPTAPEWRCCSKGLNIEGRCANPGCCAYRRMIIDRKHFDMFNLILDDNVRCPMCGHTVKPVTCGLYSCNWRYDGVKTSDGLSIGSPWQDAQGYVYYRFEADENSGSVDWASLLMIVKPRDESVSVNMMVATNSEEINWDEMCSICWSPFGSPSKCATNRCGHNFHRVCSSEWAKWCKHNHTQPSCPICRRTV